MTNRTIRWLIPFAVSSLEESGTCLCLCSAQNVKVMKSQTNVGKRPSRLSQGSQVSMQCSECQSNGNLKQAWEVMTIKTRVAPAELWLRDDLENIYALLFRFLGFGFRLAMSNVGWHVTQKFVILVPDPTAFAPWPVLLDPGEPCDSC